VGEINRWLGTCTDIQEQKAAAEKQELLTRELSHRIKNIFAVISGLITLSLRRQPELAQLGGDLQQRVLALGRAHDFVRPPSEQSRSSHSHSSLHGMLDSLLGAYQAFPGERIRISGEDVQIDDRSATPLALFFHELATNAAKYGALSANEGRVEIEIDTADGEFVALGWTERGGPPVQLATERGFGAVLIDMSITRQLGGTLDYDWRAEGLCVRARIPAQMMAR
jgi:two-component sensor histidine kinase